MTPFAVPTFTRCSCCSNLFRADYFVLSRTVHHPCPQVDFEEDMMRSAFAVLNNPVSESACGCGSSFAVKNFEKNPALD